MNLKKLNPQLKINLANAEIVNENEMQSEVFSFLKSGADCVIESPDGSGKSTLIAISVLQNLAGSSIESIRALIFCKDRDAVVEMVNIIESLDKDLDLLVYGVHSKGDTDYDKNVISAGLDILVGTHEKINALFSTAGFNMNTVKMFIVDDADVIFKNRGDAAVQRLSMSIAKTQRIFFTSKLSERVEIMSEKIMIEPQYFEYEP